MSKETKIRVGENPSQISAPPLVNQTIFARYVERLRALFYGGYLEKYGYQPPKPPLREHELGILLHRSPQEVTSFIRSTLNAFFSQNEVTSMLLLTKRRVSRVRNAAAQVSLLPRENLLELTIDGRFVEVLLDMVDAGEGFTMQMAQRELAYILYHELWHVLDGHLYCPPDLMGSPVHQLAVEIMVNDGNLNLWYAHQRPPFDDWPFYPFVSLKTTGLYDAVEATCQQMGYNLKEVVTDVRLLHEVLSKIVETQLFSVTLEMCSCGQGSGDGQQQSSSDGSGQGSSGEHQVLVVTNMKTGERRVFHDFQVLSPDQRDRNELNEFLRDLIGHLDERFQFDPANNRIRYSPTGAYSTDRVLTPKAYILPWSRIREVLEVRPSVGLDRRTYHMHPPGKEPLITRKRTKSGMILAYLDCSGSVTDEQLSAFLGTCRMSPYRVRLKYFSTEVSDEPHSGGTSFQCVVDDVKDVIASGEQVKAVIVFTDGYAERVELPMKKGWYWVVFGDPAIPELCGGTVLRVIKTQG